MKRTEFQDQGSPRAILTVMPIILLVVLVCLSPLTLGGQVLLSRGVTYSQNFDSLSNAPAGKPLR